MLYLLINYLKDIDREHKLSICPHCGTIYKYKKYYVKTCKLCDCDSKQNIQFSVNNLYDAIEDVFESKNINVLFIDFDTRIDGTVRWLTIMLNPVDVKFLKATKILPENSYLHGDILNLEIPNPQFLSLSLLTILQRLIKWSKFIPNDRINLQNRCVNCKFWKCVESHKSGGILDGYCKKNKIVLKNIKSSCELFKKGSKWR